MKPTRHDFNSDLNHRLPYPSSTPRPTPKPTPNSNYAATMTTTFTVVMRIPLYDSNDHNSSYNRSQMLGANIASSTVLDTIDITVPSLIYIGKEAVVGGRKFGPKP
ncbi:hypothetical protein LIER_38639 [Lithospermum erythrorhizon]|uniref:Uncharacterized protein n=1 Tax=Lithospermum erythrorhizon TaxID=34254 RepID=A0AAV3Q2X8_LITER